MRPSRRNIELASSAGRSLMIECKPLKAETRDEFGICTPFGVYLAYDSSNVSSAAECVLTLGISLHLAVSIATMKLCRSCSERTFSMPVMFGKSAGSSSTVDIFEKSIALVGLSAVCCLISVSVGRMTVEPSSNGSKSVLSECWYFPPLLPSMDELTWPTTYLVWEPLAPRTCPAVVWLRPMGRIAPPPSII